MDVLKLLKKDHQHVKRMFNELKKLAGHATPKTDMLVTNIHDVLTLHSQLEEEQFYPALRAIEVPEATRLVTEALEEHRIAARLLAEIADLTPQDDHYHAKVTVLREYVLHHVKEEEKELFALANKHLSADTREELGTMMATRQRILRDQYKTNSRPDETQNASYDE